MKNLNLIPSMLASLSLFNPLLASAQDLFSLTGNSSSLTVTSMVPNHTYPQAGIKINSPGYQLSGVGSECTMAPTGYCLFSVSDTAPKSISISGSGKNVSVDLCLNGNGPLSCQGFEISTGDASKGGYFTNNGSTSVYYCTFDPSTNLIDTCIDAGQSGTLGFDLQGVIVNKAQTMAYFTTQSSSIFQCEINPSDNTFSSCTPTAISTPTGYLGEFGFLTFDSTESYAYIVDSYNRVLSCPVSAGIISGNCSDSSATSVESAAAGIVINKSDSVAYIADGFSEGFVVMCDVSGSTFSNCGPLDGGGDITFSAPIGLAFNPSQSILYVADAFRNAVYGCSTAITSTKRVGSFSDCFTALTPDLYYYLWGITLNAQGTMAYVSDNDGDVYQCPILNDGTFGACTDYQNGNFFDTVNGMALIE